MTQVVGKPTPRVEGQLKVTGKALYSADLTLPDSLWGKCLRSPIPYGRIKRIDTSKAMTVPGVKAVVTGQDVAGLRIGRCIYDTPIVADGVVRFALDFHCGQGISAHSAQGSSASARPMSVNCSV